MGTHIFPPDEPQNHIAGFQTHFMGTALGILPSSGQQTIPTTLSTETRQLTQVPTHADCQDLQQLLNEMKRGAREIPDFS